MTILQERVITTIAKAVPLDRSLIKPDSTFDELGVESLDVVNIVFELEDEFEIEIPNDFNMSELETIADVTRAIEFWLTEGGDDAVRQVRA